MSKVQLQRGASTLNRKSARDAFNQLLCFPGQYTVNVTKFPAKYQTKASEF